MTRRQVIAVEAQPDRFERVEATTFNGRHVERGTEVTIRGAGRCRFLALVHNPRNGASWLDVVDSRGALRSFDPARLTRVHRTVKMKASQS